MRRLALLSLLCLTVVLSVPVNLFAQNSAQPERTLNVIDTDPVAGAEYIGGVIALYFDAVLDCATAANAITSESISGTTTCDGSTLTFTPDVVFAPATEYTFTVSDALRSSDGIALAEPYRFVVRVRGYLQVMSTVPSMGADDVETDSEIIIVFNRPVVPLTTLDEQEGLPDPLIFDPPVEGDGAWIGTSVYQFVPAGGLDGGTTYTVTVDSRLTAVDGAQQAEPYTFEFRTPNPQILEFYPTAEAADVRLDGHLIHVRFNQPMDRASTEEAFFLNIQEVPGEIPGEFAWSDDSTHFSFAPERLSLDTSYTYGFAADVALNASRSQSLAPFSINFYTARFPAIVDTYPRDGATNAPPYNGIVLSFASRMNPETILERIVVEPAPENGIDGYFSEYNNEYTALFPLRGATRYTVTLLPGMEDVYGNTIDETLVFSFETGDQDAELSLNIPYSGIGLYDADRPETQLYVTHMNVERIDLSLYEIDTQRVADSLMSPMYYQTLNNMSNAPDALIKTWSMDGAAVRNVRRLDLVNVGEAGTADAQINGVSVLSCPGAMPSRANVGDRAQIITSPDPTRARSAPVNGDILELLYRGYNFPIVGGPECHNGIVWWQVELRDGQQAWVAEGLNGEYFFEVTQSAGTTGLPVSSLSLDGGPLPIGVYLLRAQSPQLSERAAVDHLMLVANTALMVKHGTTRSVVWVNDLHTGQPLPGVTVTLYSEDAETMTAVSDADGVATFEHPPRESLYERTLALVNDGERFGITSSMWNDNLYPYQFGVSLTYQPLPYQFFVYTDRPVYRPGQDVHYRGIARAKRDNDYSLTSYDELYITIRTNGSGEEVWSGLVPLSPYGTFEGTFTLDADASLGSYEIVAKRPDVPRNSFGYDGRVEFDVAQYRLPEFEVTVTAESPEVINGDTITAVVDTRYFFGGPVSNTRVFYYVRTEASGFDYTGSGRYSFIYTDPTPPSEPFSPSFNSEGQTDSSGMLTIEFPAATGPRGQTLGYVIEAVATDQSGQSVSGTARVQVHQGEVYVGVAARDYIGGVGQPVVFDLISVDTESQRIAGQTIELQLVERRWNSVQELGPYGDIIWKSEVEIIPVADGTVTTDAQGNAEFSFVPPNGGLFQLIASTRDEHGNLVRAAGSVWVVGGGYVAWQQSNATGIQLISDKDSYTVGDTAEILIPSPFMGRTEALITLERDGVLRTEHLTLESNSTVYRLPIEEDFAPTIYFGVVLMKGVDETTPVADMRIGYVTINVDNERFALNLDIGRDTEIAGPRDTVVYTIRATDYAGAPVQAELGVALTDLAALSLAPDPAGEILDYFYGAEALAVTMSNSMTINTDLLTEFTRDVFKGGGGGGGGGFGIFDLREQFIDTAFWDGRIETDENGVATVAIPLPDNLTTWRLVVRGVTDGVDRPMLVGQATDDLIATRPLIVRPVAPRFMVRGDEVTLGAVVNNNTLDALEVEVAIQASGVTLADASAQTVTIPAQSRARVNWTATVEDVEAVELLFAASAGDLSDATRPAFGQGDDRLLPVYKYEVPEFVGTGGTLREASARVEAVVLPRRYEVTEGTLTVELEPSLAVTTLNTIEALKGSVCECTETIASRLVANVAGLRALQALGDPNDPRIEELRTEANLGVQRLIRQQHVDGGWGWFQSVPSDPLVTAWTLIALNEARDVITVNTIMTDDAVDYLSRHLVTNTRSSPGYSTLNLSALILYAMSQAGATNLSAPISNLFDLRDRLSIYGKALLLMSITDTTEEQNAVRARVLRDDIMNDSVISANGAHWQEESRDWINWNSDTRTTSIVLRALLMNYNREPLLPNVVRWLMIARQGDMWETTQETAWVLLALTDWMLATGETAPTFGYTVAINDEEAGGRTLTPADADTQEIILRDVTALSADEPNLIEIARDAGSGALYYTAYLNAYLPVPEVSAVDNGIHISRVYRPIGSDEPVTEARVGDLLEVTVTIVAPTSLNYLVVEDPLPAGLEAINPDLSTSQQTGTEASFRIADDRAYYTYARYWWADVQYRDEKVVLSTEYIVPGTYEFTYVVRATVEGTYNVIPTTGREYYLPEVYGRGEGSLFTVLPAEDE